MHDLTFLHIDRLIVHELPRTGTTGATPGVLSDGVSPLPTPVRHFFEERIRTALTVAGIPIQVSTGSSSPVPTLVEGLLAATRLTPKKFVSASQKIASHLFGIQNAVHSQGLLCVASCSLKNDRAVAIIKLEMEDGVRAKLKGAQGKQHFEIEVVDDLMLTKHTRFFKVAMFEAEDGEIEARACDNQRARGQLLAEYFLDTFLGCELVAKPDVSTKMFLEAAESFFNSSVGDATLRSRYHTALLSELSSNHTAVRMRAFAEDHLEARDRAGFVGALRDAGVPGSFAKDTSLVRTRLHRTRLEFDDDVSVLLPPEALNKTVKMEEIAGGKTKLAVESRLKGVRGAR